MCTSGRPIPTLWRKILPPSSVRQRSNRKCEERKAPCRIRVGSQSLRLGIHVQATYFRTYPADTDISLHTYIMFSTYARTLHTLKLSKPMFSCTSLYDQLYSLLTSVLCPSSPQSDLHNEFRASLLYAAGVLYV